MGFLDGGFCETGALPEGASSLPGHYWHQSSHNPRLSLPFFGLFWLWLLWVIGAAAPILALASLAFSPGSGRGICFLAFAPVLASCPFVLGRAVGPGPPRAFFCAFAFWPLRRPWLFALLSWAVRSGMALRWPSSLPLPCGLWVGLCLLLFCFGLCGLAWPSGGLFVCAATMGGGLPFLFGCAARWVFGRPFVWIALPLFRCR